MTALKLYPWERTQLWLSDGCYVRLKKLFSRKCHSLGTLQQFKCILVPVSLHLPSEISHIEKEEIWAQIKNNVQHELYGAKKCTESWVEGHIKMTPASLFSISWCLPLWTWDPEALKESMLLESQDLWCNPTPHSLLTSCNFTNTLRSLFPHKVKSTCFLWYSSFRHSTRSCQIRVPRMKY